MLQEIAIARQYELLADSRAISARIALEQTRKLDRMQESVRVIRARLGLAPSLAA